MLRILLVAAALGLAAPAQAGEPGKNFVEFFLHAEARAANCTAESPTPGDPPKDEGKGDVNADTCTCSISPGPACPSGCATCETRTDSCTCTTGCSIGGCAAGYTEIDSVFCPSCLCFNETCRRTASVTTGYCSSCPAGRYGNLCNPCPGCNGRGTCHDGISGDGLCNCNVGSNGPFCEYTDALTCSGHGTAQYNGSCTCFPGFMGASCNQCATDYYSYPTCRFCQASSTCNSHGACDVTGN
jgi:hypothetical protein